MTHPRFRLPFGVGHSAPCWAAALALFWAVAATAAEAPAPPQNAAPQNDEAAARLARLKQQGFPLVNYHAHLKGGLTIEELVAHGKQTGISYGVALNCGKGFPVTSDEGIHEFLEKMRGQPVLLGMQAEGREWVTMFSPAAVAKFDYVFTDAMTLTDHRGRRTRLWMKDEVDLPDPQAFMDLLVETTVGILRDEPIDVYVNPTFLPAAIAADYDALWTPRRIERVIDAAVANGVAIEINDRLRLPKAAFIKLAKQKGAKFSFGVNNADRDLGRLEYCLKMVEECGLTPQDMFTPRPDGRKPIQLKGLKRK